MKRRQSESDSDSDLSPVRRHKSSDSDLSPPRKSHKESSDSDLSPPRHEKDEERTIVRDFQGKAVTEQQLRERKSKLDRKFESLSQMEWGKGLVQAKQSQSFAKEHKKSAAAPLARYIDDSELNQNLRNTERWGDPLLAAKSVSKKQKMQISARPMYKGVPFSNRFGILPGYRWDGVDRSNGWERKRLDIMEQSKSSRLETYDDSYD
jgi:pre-mRNA-splicing factor CWC26